MKRFLNASLHPCWLPALRIGTGVLLLLDFLALWADFARLYGADALADPALARAGSDFLFPAAFLGGWWLFSTYTALCLALMLGCCTRLCAALLWLLHHQVFAEASFFMYGPDHVVASALLYCLLFPTGHYLSLDRLIFRPTASDLETASLRVLQLHLCVFYFFGGLAKLLGPSWWDGSAVWQALNLPGMEGPLSTFLSYLPHWPLFWTVAGWVVMGLELGYSFVIWMPRVRKAWLYAILGLHAGIALLLGLYFFSAMMALLNLVAFYIPYLPAKRQKPAYIRWLNHLTRLPRPTESLEKGRAG